MQINHLRIKRKRKGKALNPEDTAEQKLIEISRYQDHQEILEEPDVYIKVSEKVQPEKEHIYTQVPAKSVVISSFFRDLSRRQKRVGWGSVNEKPKKIKQPIKKQPLTPTNYLLIDTRRSQETLGFSQRLTKYETHGGMKPKLISRQEKILGFQRKISQSFQLKRNLLEERVRSLRGRVVCAIQIKEGKVLSKSISRNSN